MNVASTREIWLSNPANPDLPEAELKALIGQYVLEAMQLIENDMQKREAILISRDSTISECVEALNTGLWYPLQYYARIKPYKDNPTFTPRFSYFQKSGGFIHGSMSNKLWTQPPDNTATGSYPTFKWKKETQASPAEEIVKILEGKSFCLVDCAAVTSLVHYAALLRIWGKERFDKCFSGRSPYSVPLVLSNYASINPMNFFIERISTSHQADVMAGDKAGFKSHPSYHFKHPYGGSSGWNVFCVPADKVLKFVGFGLGAEALDETQVLKKLVDDYNQEPEFDDDLYTGERKALTREYFDKNRSAFLEGDHPTVINQETLKAQGGGCTGEYIRLNTAKIRMIMREPVETCSLFHVFRASTPQATDYALEEATKNMWRRNMLLLLVQNKTVHPKNEVSFSGQRKK